MAAAKKAAKKTEGATIEVPPLQVQRIKLRLRGRGALITNKWDPKAIQMIEDKQSKKAKMPKEAKDPKACFEAARYLDENGDDCVMALGVKQAIVKAARYADDANMTFLRGALFVLGKTRDDNGHDLIPIQYKEVRMRRDMVRVGMGVADVRYRPEYTNWSLDIEIEYNSHVISAAQVINLVRLAGFGVGLCEWRPEKNGDFGRFDVETTAAMSDEPKAQAAE